MFICHDQNQGGHSLLFVRIPKILVRERSWERSRNIRWSVFFATFETSLFANAECSCSRVFVTPFARTLPNKNKNIRPSIFYASLGSDRRSRDENYITFCSVRLLPLPTFLYSYNYDVITFRERECVKLLAATTTEVQNNRINRY